jgi:NO-binding membrane sensor protein with MHYT domain
VSEVHHFSYGVVTPAVAYAMSCIGALLGLLCTARARGGVGRSRAAWLALAAVSIGGTGIWVMHFIAMLGFQVPGKEIRYNVPVTLLSALIAVVVVGIGLFIVGFGGTDWGTLVTGGLFTGLGVASMHYLGMSALRMAAHVSYQPLLVALSVLIAVVAATVALWFTVRVRGNLATLGAALVMGVAVTGMHYTGMAAMRVHDDTSLGDPAGARAFDFLLPLIVGISVVALILLVTIGLSPTEDEMVRERELLRRVLARRTEVVTPKSVQEEQQGETPRSAGRWFGGGD